MSLLVLLEFTTANGIYVVGDQAAVPRDYADRLIAAGVARIVEPKGVTKGEAA